MKRWLVIGGVVLVLAAIGSMTNRADAPSATGPATRTEAPVVPPGDPATGAPPALTEQPPAWSLDVSDVRYTRTALVGGTIELTATVTNSGTGPSGGVKFQISDLSDYADLIGCIPKCTTSEGFGDFYATFEPIAAGAEATYEFGFIPTDIGAAHWSVCVYDDETSGEQIYCGDATTVIR